MPVKGLQLDSKGYKGEKDSRGNTGELFRTFEPGWGVGEMAKTHSELVKLVLQHKKGLLERSN